MLLKLKEEVDVMVEAGNVNMDIDEEKCDKVKSRLGNCEVCGTEAAKYCCPKCEVKTCALPCLNIHKEELDCDGVRSRVKFKMIQQFSNLDLSNDYKMLEEINRAVESPLKLTVTQMTHRRSDKVKGRLGNCEVCGTEAAKYCCPKCEVKTCALPCLNIHKEELDCDGVRSRVKFKMIQQFSNLDLSNDYKMLEEINRAVETYHKTSAMTRSDLPKFLICLRAAAARRHVQLHFLPKTFARRKSNSTFLDFQTQELYWKIDWIFPQAEFLKYTDVRVIDTTRLSNAVDHLLNPLVTRDKRLEFYQAAGHSGNVLLMKADKVTCDKFYLLDPSLTIRENFSGKIIVENPEIHVLHKDHKHMYDILSVDEEDAINDRIRQDAKNRRQTGQNRNQNPINNRNNQRRHNNFNGNKNFQSSNQTPT
ncbi:box C/D snoRNA protein 1 [Nilaparvata lugens]|uniref:box C/D snoRNA protein 1 n=1 Tax=Nilaparvata lugens TaxID=108931 RepID=UPI00193D4A3E|nr:box C/D snoRNA protein 1 [Nilaparvata lugens]